VQDALLLSQQVRNLFYPSSTALYQDHLGTDILVKVDMCAGQDLAIVVMLQIGQLSAQLPEMVVVNEGNRANCLLVSLPLLFNQAVTDHVPDELGTIRIATSLNHLRKAIQQGLFYR